MKMPVRPFTPPPMPVRDIFGLIRPTLLAAAAETDAERDTRLGKIAAGTRAAFEAAVAHLGEEKARRLFVDVARKPARRGRGTAIDPDRDRILLEIYDGRQSDRSLAEIAREAEATALGAGRYLGANPKAIEAQLRKLIDERERRARAAARETRRWRMATRNEPPTLLAEASEK